MKIKCCGQSKKRKGVRTTVLKDAIVSATAVEYAELLYNIIDKDLKMVGDKDLNILYNFVANITLGLTTELVKRGG